MGAGTVTPDFPRWSSPAAWCFVSTVFCSALAFDLRRAVLRMPFAGAAMGVAVAVGAGVTAGAVGSADGSGATGDASGVLVGTSGAASVGAAVGVSDGVADGVPVSTGVLVAAGTVA